MNIELTATDAGQQQFAAVEESFQENGLPARAACNLAKGSGRT
jgi:hypothetical protein